MFDDGENVGWAAVLSMAPPEQDSFVAALVTTTMKSSGSTSLAQVDNTYSVNGTSGPQLRYFGAVVTEGQFDAWKPIGAEQAGSGYLVAWQLGTADQYTIWNVDGAGNYVPGHTITSGGTHALKWAEKTFKQDSTATARQGSPRQ